MQQIGVNQDLAKLQSLLGSRLYSSRFSFISEVLQNSCDAMRRAGKLHDPFDVGIYEDTEEGGYYMTVRDYGCSFADKEEFIKYGCTLLESSKTQQKDDTEYQEIGKLGIGIGNF